MMIILLLLLLMIITILLLLLLLLIIIITIVIIPFGRGLFHPSIKNKIRLGRVAAQRESARLNVYVCVYIYIYIYKVHNILLHYVML